MLYLSKRHGCRMLKCVGRVGKCDVYCIYGCVSLGPGHFERQYVGLFNIASNNNHSSSSMCPVIMHAPTRWSSEISNLEAYGIVQCRLPERTNTSLRPHMRRASEAATKLNNPANSLLRRAGLNRCTGSKGRNSRCELQST
jgi:hypothetical protein